MNVDQLSHLFIAVFHHGETDHNPTLLVYYSEKNNCGQPNNTSHTKEGQINVVFNDHIYVAGKKHRQLNNRFPFLDVV